MPNDLSQIVGALLRDIAESRYASDLYSRQVSRIYEKDALLRHFPVPRVEVTEVEFDLNFVIASVEEDKQRHIARSARLSTIFEKYAIEVVRAGLGAFREQAAAVKDPTPEQREALDRFEKAFFNEQFRDLLQFRVLHYFEDNQAELIKTNLEGGFESFDKGAVDKDVLKFVEGLAEQSSVIQDVMAKFPEEKKAVIEKMHKAIMEKLVGMSKDIESAFQQSKDFRVEVDVTPEKVKEAGSALSSLKIKSVVKNYLWSKVDVDREDKDMRAIRTLNPE